VSNPPSYALVLGALDTLHMSILHDNETIEKSTGSGRKTLTRTIMPNYFTVFTEISEAAWALNERLG
jgi:hypothetical protein